MKNWSQQLISYVVFHQIWHLMILFAIFFWHFSTILLLPQGIKFVSIVHSIKFDATRLVEVVVELWGLEQKSIRQLLVSLKNRNREKTFSLTFTIPSIINWLVKKKGQYCDAVSRQYLQAWNLSQLDKVVGAGGLRGPGSNTPAPSPDFGKSVIPISTGGWGLYYANHITTCSPGF